MKQIILLLSYYRKANVVEADGDRCKCVITANK